MIKQQMLNWARPCPIFIYLDSNRYALPYGRYECLLAAGARHTITSEADDGLGEINRYHQQHGDWLFGHICYDYKNELESRLRSGHPKKMGFPELLFFVPETVCYIPQGSHELYIESWREPAMIFDEILAAPAGEAANLPRLGFTKRIEREDYLKTIGSLREHIRNGDCYEINFCNEGFCEDAFVEPLQVFDATQALSPAPFAAFYRCMESYMLCSSPERFLEKEGTKVVSQPIKGTARRGVDEADDERQKRNLLESEKERAENIMITDLVRNDLARSCMPGSITVEELFGIYTFPQVHQMISTVSGTLRPGVPFTDAIRYAFPMGSMTGAPKYKVLQLIEHYERARRELFSGTVGYITPDGDFDFNVVIRSLFYNAATKYLSYQTGGAITWDSVPEQEWEESRLKAWALERIFSGENL